MRVRIKGQGPRGAILNENGEVQRSRRSIVRTAKELRQDMTPAEQFLWKKLRNKSLGGWKFYRQVPIDRFIVDFYCPEKKLVIEIDGGVHDEVDVSENDALREEVLRDKGLRILRFRNEEVLNNLSYVCDQITQCCQKYLT